MISVLDNNLTLVYKNMVGLSNIVTDTSSNSNFTASITVNSNLFINGSSQLNNNVSINSNLFISGRSILNNNTSINSSLNVSGSSILNGFTSINSSLNISGLATMNNLVINNNSVYNNSVTINNSLNVSGMTIFNNGINTNSISGTSININAQTINIGNPNSIVYINGTATYVASTESLIVDKLISLNINTSTLQGADNGMLSGIEILGISSYGFIKTTADSSRYQMRIPLLDAPTTYITIQDLNNNLVISGTTTLIGTTTINSSLNVSSYSIFNNSININNSLNISGNTNINGYCTINNSLFINGKTVINNATSINSSLNISGVANINNNASINSSLNISGTTIINGNMTILSYLNISGVTNINGNCTINNSLNISGNTIINSSFNINNNLNISSFANIVGNEKINGNLLVSNISILNSNTTINSSLSISGSALFNSSVSINSNLGILGQMVSQLPNYLDNTSAKNGNVPVWGWYRTGGIIKIRLNDTPPTIYLNGGTSLSINVYDTFTDQGAYALDFNNNYNPVYLTILSGNSNLLSNLLISGSTLITQTSSFPAGSYTATYQATDSGSLSAYNYRLLNITIPTPISSFDLTAGTLRGVPRDYSSLTNSDWTFDAYIYQTYPVTHGRGWASWLLDLRTNDIDIEQSLIIHFSTANGIGVLMHGYIVPQFNNFPSILNVWNHWAIMQKNMMLYAFCNGIMVQSIDLVTLEGNYTRNFSNCQGLTIGGSSTDVNSTDFFKYYGKIGQMMMRLGAQYPISGFTPSVNLLPVAQQTWSQTLLFIDAGPNGNPMDLVTNNYLTKYGTVVSGYRKTYTPSIVLNGSNSIDLYINTTYTDLGATATDYLGNTISYTITGTVNTTQVGSNTLTYTVSNVYGSASITRTVNVRSAITPYDSTIIQTSYRQSSSYMVNPVFQSSPNLWYWTPPYNTNGFGGSGQSWALSSTYLTSINFTYNSSWCFVFKCNRTKLGDDNLDMEFDSNKSDWGPNNGAGQGGGSKDLGIQSSSASGAGFPSINFTSNNIYNTGIYINISFNYVNSTSTDNGYLKVEVIDLSGNTIFSNTGNSIMSYSNKVIPFHIYYNADAYTFYTGVYYNKIGYVNYSQFSPFFT